MKSKLSVNLAVFFLALFIGLLLCEGLARLVTRTDASGQVYYRRRALLPYRFPAEMVRRKMDHYLKRKSEAYVIDDPLLGWTTGPARSNVNGMYRTNSEGIRSEPREYSPLPPPGTLRIELFGDSFTHGDEEPFDKTWGKFLEDDLGKAGVRAEVLNFGVPAYGIGQAYLRWKYQGRKFSPRIAVFGFQPENMKRTVNIFRSLYSRDTWVVFSKPRFIINPEGRLELINSPVVPPEEVADVLEKFNESPLSRYEFWFNPDNYFSSPLFESRLVSLVYSFLAGRKHRPGGRHDHQPGEDYWDTEGEPMQTSLLILKRFAREARESGEIPIILHIPKKSVLQVLEKGSTPTHSYVLQELEKEGITVVDPAPEMTGKHRLYKHSHFSSRGGRIVARVLAEAIIELLKERNLFSEYSRPE